MNRLDAGSENINEEWKTSANEQQLKKNDQVQEAITVNDQAATREKTNYADVSKWREWN